MWFHSGQRQGFIFSHRSRLALGPSESPIQRVEKTVSPGEKKSGRKADNMWSNLYSPISFHGIQNNTFPCTSLFSSLPLLPFTWTLIFPAQPTVLASRHDSYTFREISLTFYGKDLCIRVACGYPILAANSRSVICNRK